MLWKLIAKNPFFSLKAHMQKTTQCVAKTKTLFEALFEGDKEKVTELTREISRIEHECDEIKREIRVHLSKSVFLPVERRDILHVLSNMDSVADGAEDLGVLLSLRWMELPSDLQVMFMEFLSRAILVVEASEGVINSLDRLLEAGFSGPDAQEVISQIDEVDRLEHVADKAQDMFGKELFVQEDSFKPAALFMWIKIANKVGDLANNAERMVNHIRLMMSPK